MKSIKIKSAIFTVLFLTASIFSTNAAVMADYTVNSGDSLWKISTYYKTSVDSIIKLNNLNSSNLYIGQKLIVDDNRITNINYKVNSGDTLWKLSQKFNTTVDNIVKLNSLSNSNLYIGQNLLIPINAQQVAPPVEIKPVISIVNYKIAVGDNLWTIAQKYNTTMDTIIKSNMLASSTIMPGQILTIPINSTQIVKPVGIAMMKARLNNNYGDLYTWENARRLFTVDATGKLKDLYTGITFNAKYYGGSNHADIVPLTKADTANMLKIFGSWSWNNRPMILYFTQGGVNYQLAVSVAGMPHSTTNIYDNGISGHFDMYFYNSTSHINNTISPTHQANILKANGQ